MSWYPLQAQWLQFFILRLIFYDLQLVRILIWYQSNPTPDEIIKPSKYHFKSQSWYLHPNKTATIIKVTNYNASLRAVSRQNRRHRRRSHGKNEYIPSSFFLLCLCLCPGDHSPLCSALAGPMAYAYGCLFLLKFLSEYLKQAEYTMSRRLDIGTNYSRHLSIVE